MTRTFFVLALLLGGAFVVAPAMAGERLNEGLMAPAPAPSWAARLARPREAPSVTWRGRQSPAGFTTIITTITTIVTTEPVRPARVDLAPTPQSGPPTGGLFCAFFPVGVFGRSA